MAIKKYHKIDIALEQLNIAIELFLNGKSYIAALTLAGAAEEILGKALSHKRQSNAVDESFSIDSYFEKQIKDARSQYFDEKHHRKLFIKIINGPRNDFKHWADESQSIIQMDIKECAKDMIVRACGNCDRLGIQPTDSIESFNDWFWEHEEGINVMRG
ncbi:MAG: hypothetical protein ACU843_08535 [Gammaproteobacteria bacterium]